MWAISESEISVPIDISAAAFKTASRSSGRIAAKSVSAQFVRKPRRLFDQICGDQMKGKKYPFFGRLWRMPDCRQ
jgi:hypothetical protein